MVTQDKKVKFLPYHAVNEFMRDDYRSLVIKDTLTALPYLPENNQKNIKRLIQKYVRVPGFRNSSKAPIPIQAKACSDAFEKHPQFVAQLLAGWAESKIELRLKVYNLLNERGWEILPIEADRTKLPGFRITWPKDEDFETLNTAFNEMYSHSDNEDDISLIVVWMSMRLPYQQEGEDFKELDEI